MKQRLPSLGELAESILAEVAAEKNTKEAAAPVGDVPVGTSELSQLLYKLATELRTHPATVSYTDLAEYLKEQRR